MHQTKTTFQAYQSSKLKTFYAIQNMNFKNIHKYSFVWFKKCIFKKKNDCLKTSIYSGVMKEHWL